jgi:predicted DNA-binding transcriptional regulator YafY
LDRISGDVSVGKKSESFNIPDSIYESTAEEKPSAKVLLRKGRGHQFRAIAESIISGDDWDTAQVPVFSEQWLLSLVFWHRDDVLLLEPADLRLKAIESLQEMRASHG